MELIGTLGFILTFFLYLKKCRRFSASDAFFTMIGILSLLILALWLVPSFYNSLQASDPLTQTFIASMKVFYLDSVISECYPLILAMLCIAIPKIIYGKIRTSLNQI